MEIQYAINSLIQGRTVIVIAHKLKTISDADKIIVLDGGNIVEQGTHEQLLKMRDYMLIYGIFKKNPVIGK